VEGAVAVLSLTAVVLAVVLAGIELIAQEI
jgi:hypothetical protein